MDGPTPEAEGKLSTPTAAHRVYNTPEIFENVVSYLTVAKQAELLQLDKRSLSRGLMWLEKRVELYRECRIDTSAALKAERDANGAVQRTQGGRPAGRPTDEPSSSSGRELYQAAARAAVRHLYLNAPAPARIFGDPDPQSLFDGPDAVCSLERLFPRLQRVELHTYDGRQDEPGKGSYKHHPMFGSLHVATKTFYVNLVKNIPPGRNQPPPTTCIPDLAARWTSQGFHVVYRMCINIADRHNARFTPERLEASIDLLTKLAQSMATDTRIMSVHFEFLSNDCLDRPARTTWDRLWPPLEVALQARREAGTPLHHLVVCAEIEPTPAFSTMVSAATAGGAKHTAVFFSPHAAERLLAEKPFNTVDTISICRYGPGHTFGDDDSPAPEGHRVRNVHERLHISLGPSLSCFRRPESLYDFSTLTSLGHHLWSLELDDHWELIIERSTPELSKLAAFVSVCKTYFVSLRRLSFSIDAIDFSDCRTDLDLDISSQSWGGQLDQLSIHFEPDTCRRFPYFAFARNLACLCHSATVFETIVHYDTDQDGYDIELLEVQTEDDDDRGGTRVKGVPQHWRFIQTDLGDLVRWLLSLSPARQSHIRSADFDALGLLPPVRAAHNWRDLKFFEDEPIPIDLQRQSDDYKRWCQVGQGNSAEAEQARKLERRIDHLFKETS